jgi:phosphoribosylformylglycinamidine cyclo-ligase
MIEGMGEVCKEQNLVALNGETAELGVCVSSENPNAQMQFNWAGFTIGAYHRNKMITGETLAPGQWVVAFKETGFRSNGHGSVRKAFGKKYGPEWYRNLDAASDMIEAAAPSVLYDRFLTWLNGWYESDFDPIIKLHLIVHLTGGAIRTKLAEDVLFPRGLSAHLDNLWEPPEIMRKCAQWRGMSDQECYETWNGGQGALAVVDSCDYGLLEAQAKRHGLEIQVCGKIIHSKNPSVTIRSRFSGQTIVFES